MNELCRDPIGICPLYWGKGADGSMWFASEMKALQHRCVTFDIFPPVSLPFLLVDVCRSCPSAGPSFLLLVAR